MIAMIKVMMMIHSMNIFKNNNKTPKAHTK